MATICLNMIVKDEAEVIGRLLESVKGLIDTWVICDTGSTDGTQEIIRAALADIPGELHERPWVDFGHNRSEALRLARGHADYLLLLDADMTVSFDRAALARLDADSYMIRHSGELEYRIKRLVRGDREWWYEGSTHEYIATSGPERSEPLDAIVVHHHADGGSRADKFERDIALLTRDLERDPENARAAFYLAQSHRDVGDLERAIELYRRRAAMGGWEEEVFYALYQVGVLEAGRGDWAAAVPALLEAWNFRPTRIEPLHDLAVGYRERGQHQLALLFAQRGLNRPRPDDILFVQPWIYRFGMLFEYSIAAYWAGDPQGALHACDRLLRQRDLPPAYREQTIENREFCVQAVWKPPETKVKLRGQPLARG